MHLLVEQTQPEIQPETSKFDSVCNGYMEPIPIPHRYKKIPESCVIEVPGCLHQQQSIGDTRHSRCVHCLQICFAEYVANKQIEFAPCKAEKPQNLLVDRLD